MFSRNNETSKSLAHELSAESVSEFDDGADIYIVSVPDDVLQRLSLWLKSMDRECLLEAPVHATEPGFTAGKAISRISPGMCHGEILLAVVLHLVYITKTAPQVAVKKIIISIVKEKR